MESVGMKSMGIEPVGIESMGIEPVGIEPVGIEPMEIEPVGIELMGTEPMGVESLRVPRAICMAMTCCQNSSGRQGACGHEQFLEGGCLWWQWSGVVVVVSGGAVGHDPMKQGRVS